MDQTQTDDDRTQELSDAGADVEVALRRLYRLTDGDEAAVGEMLYGIDKAARINAAEAGQKPARVAVVDEYGTVGITWHHSVKVPAGLTDEEADAFVTKAIQSGDALHFDSSTGDAIETGDVGDIEYHDQD